MSSAAAYPIEGACQCGAVRYRVTKPFRLLAVCHCLDCQKLSASAFSMTMLLDADGFELVQGSPKKWTYAGSSGAPKDAFFCADCGCRLWHLNPKMPQLIRLKPGTLGDTSFLQPDYHVWVKRKQPWITIPDWMSRFDTEPASMQEAIAAVAATRTKRAQMAAA